MNTSTAIATVTASSSAMQSVGSSHVQLRLTTTDEGEPPLVMELSLEQFYEFMRELEKLKAALEQ